MPKTITKKVYTFRELLKLEKRKRVESRAVDKARQWLQEGQTDHQWWEYSYELWKQALEQVGFVGHDIRFSGFWSPGDGASFTADLDCGKLIAFLSTEIEAKESVGVDSNGEEQFLNYVVHKLGDKTTDARFANLLAVLECLSGKVERYSGREIHEGSCFTAISCDYNEIDETRELLAEICCHDLANEFEKAVEDLRRDLCKAIYKALEENYEYLISDEALIETADANEYTLDKAGRPELRRPMHKITAEKVSELAPLCVTFEKKPRESSSKYDFGDQRTCFKALQKANIQSLHEMLDEEAVNNDALYLGRHILVGYLVAVRSSVTGKFVCGEAYETLEELKQQWILY